LGGFMVRGLRTIVTAPADPANRTARRAVSLTYMLTAPAAPTPDIHGGGAPHAECPCLRRPTVVVIRHEILSAVP